MRSSLWSGTSELDIIPLLISGNKYLKSKYQTLCRRSDSNLVLFCFNISDWFLLPWRKINFQNVSSVMPWQTRDLSPAIWHKLYVDSLKTVHIPSSSSNRSDLIIQTSFVFKRNTFSAVRNSGQELCIFVSLVVKLLTVRWYWGGETYPSK